jgi:succinate dehydrogenase hydrophobic anchor subunit
MEYCEDDTIRRLVHTLTVLAHDRKQMIESLWLTWLMTAIYLVIFVLGTIGNMITVEQIDYY